MTVATIEPTSAAAPVARRRARLADARGNPVTAATRETIVELDRFADIVLRRGRGARLALDAADAAPDCAMAQACAAATHLFSDSRSGVDLARVYLDRATRRIAGATYDEGLFVAALAAIADARPRTADRLFLALGRSAPGNLLAAYLAHLHLLNHGRFAEMLELARRICRANPKDGFALGMLSFALEQNGCVGAAEEAGLEACARDPRIPWAQHALAHVYGTQGRLAHGIALLEGHARSWERCESSMYTHNWWHLMLLRLARGETSAVLTLYDSRIAPHAARSNSSYVNAVSMLARLELAGVEIGERWIGLADQAESRIGEHVLPFLDIHDTIALAHAGRFGAVAALRRGALRHAESGSLEMRQAWRLAGIPLIEALAAYCAGDWELASQHFRRADGRVHLIGGSNAQRELFAALRIAAERRSPFRLRAFG